MIGDKIQQYDLIFSLGGSCASTLQMSSRNLRCVSLPFDWLMHPNYKQFDALMHGFTHGFDTWLQDKNLTELSADERGNSNKAQYKDTLTDFWYLHDYKRHVIDDPKLGANVRKKYARRFKRLDHFLSRARTTLLLLDVQYGIDPEMVKELLLALQTKYPKNHFDIIIQSFNIERTERHTEYPALNITINHIPRVKNDSDFLNTNADWAFLDSYGLTLWGRQILQRQLFNNLVFINYKKRKFSFVLFKGFLPALLTARFYFIPLKFEFSIGRPRD